MLTKRILAISLSLPLVATSATAYAGSTISDKSYWPGEAKQGVQTGSEFDSAFAYEQPALRFQPARPVGNEGTAWHYQGGPKSR
jgi:hypothetical protein